MSLFGSGDVRAMPPRWVHRDGCGPPAPHGGRPALRIPVDYLDGPQAAPVSLRQSLTPSPLQLLPYPTPPPSMARGERRAGAL